MRGDDNQQEGIFSYLSPEKRVPTEHPLRPIRKMVDEILKEMSPQFAKLYSSVGRPSIAPERLLRSLLLQIFYAVRSETNADRTVAVQPVVPVVCGGRLQSLPIAKPDGPSMTSDFETGQLIASHAIQITSAPSL